MTDLDYDYGRDSWSFVERAHKQLQFFDAGNPESLFYAALELRMGIEARLLEILRALLRDNHKPAEKIKEYNPKVLLDKISRLDHHALYPVTLTVGIPGSQSRTVLQFIPVTPELASDYGKVGTLLHCTFFETTQNWYAKQQLWAEYKTRSLLDYRDMLGDIAKRLEDASNSDLLAPPSFLKFFDQLNEPAIT